MTSLVTVKANKRSSGKNSLVSGYEKLVVPSSMRSLYWSFFGFPATDDGTIISRARIICTLCQTQIAYNKNTTNLRMHLQAKHLRELRNAQATFVDKRKTKSAAKEDNAEYTWTTVDAAYTAYEDATACESIASPSILPVTPIHTLGHQGRLTRKQPKRSQAWDHFKLTKSDKFAKCLLCRKEFTFHGSTTILVHHLKKKHPEKAVDDEKVEKRPKVSKAWEFFTLIKDDGFAKCELCGREFTFHGSTTVLMKHLELEHSEANSDGADDSEAESNQTAGVSGVSGTPVTPAKNSRVSKAWKHFTLTKNDQFAECTLCGKEFKYHQSTTILVKHLQTKHPESAADDGDDSQSAKAVVRRIPWGKKENMPKNVRVSRAWEHFTLTNNNEYAKCLECGKEFSFHGSTTILMHHLKQKHSKKTPADGEATDSQAEQPSKETQPLTRVVLPPPKRKSPIDVVSVIANFIVQDLMSPDIVNGVGFQRLVLNIENPCGVPTKRMLVDEILPSLYQQSKQSILSSLECVSAMALSVEEWTNSRNVPYLSIAAHFAETADKISCKMLETFPIEADWDYEMWCQVLTAVVQEWRINPDLVTAVVYSTGTTEIVSFFEGRGYSCIPCLHYLIKESMADVFAQPMLSDIIVKMRKLVNKLKKNPVYCKLYQTALADIGTPLLIDDDSMWLSSLEMLTSALIWRKTMENVMFDTPVEQTVSDEEWTTIREVTSVLKPLKMAAMSANEQKSYLSLIRPLLHQLANNKLADSEDDSDVVTELKRAIRGMLFTKYNSDSRVAAILDTATYIDPRFKYMPHFSEMQKAELGENVYSQIKDIVVQCVEEMTEEENAYANVSNTQLLLGSFHGPEEETKTSMAATARLEYQTYVAHPNVRLDHDPLEWWSKQNDKYPRLCHLAQKYLCVPSVTTLPGKNTLEQLNYFHQKRSLLDPDVVDKLLFLHVNSG